MRLTYILATVAAAISTVSAIPMAVPASEDVAAMLQARDLITRAEEAQAATQDTATDQYMNIPYVDANGNFGYRIGNQFYGRYRNRGGIGGGVSLGAAGNYGFGIDRNGYNWQQGHAYGNCDFKTGRCVGVA